MAGAAKAKDEEPNGRPEPPSFAQAESLPSEPSRQIPDRVAVLSGLFGVGFVLAWLATPTRPRISAVTSPVLGVATGAAIALSVLAFYLSRRLRDHPARLVDLALGYEVLACFTIALVEQWVPWSPGQLVRGISWVCLVLTVFPLLVPTTPTKTAVIALVAASMGPVALLITTVIGNPIPPTPVLAAIFLPSYLAAGVAFVLSRIVQKLATDVSLAKRLGSYQLEERLGRGGMGEVWRARHRLLARPAAVKLLHAEGDEPTDVLRMRFEREAQVTAALGSPHTISLYDFGVTPDGTFYYVMELLDGLDLELMVQHFGPMPAERVAHLMLQACDSLADAHRAGLIHRDIKPANIYICRKGIRFDFVKVIDFGLVALRAGAQKDAVRLTAADTAGGTPAYMAPEMAKGHDVDARTDLYALGCVAYWMLTGALVFEADTAIKALWAHVEKPPIPPSQRTEVEVPAELERLILWCLEKEPSARPGSALELARALTKSHIADAWTAEAAEKWWRSHLPDTGSTQQLAFRASSPSR